MSAGRLLLLLGLLVPGGSSAAGVLVSVNPHANELPADAPPLAALAEIPCVDANAYHVSSDREVDRALGYPSFGKPKILSDDAGGVSAADAKRWIARACEAGEHYEHFDGAVGPAAMSGEAVADLVAFPAKSREVLSYIRDESCASDLEPGGTLTREGTELLWNGAPVSLVGSSWMGILAGRNVDLGGFLDVLAAHRVNLTRVWVIEQWTGLAEESPEAPAYANAVLPFVGPLSDGKVDLTEIDGAFLERLKTLVREASARGIVVQLTLFDRHGLLPQDDQWGGFRGSPYNPANHAGDLLTPGDAGQAPPDFVDLCRPRDLGRVPRRCTVQRLHRRLVRAVRDAVAGEGNVILEVMNEPLAAEWGESPVVAFHRWIAGVALGRGEGGRRCFE